jgi:hypothetical protein
MSGFDEREKGYERKFEHDQELAFKVKARRNHLIGLWAAEKQGLTGEPAEAYAKTIMDPAAHPHGDTDIVKQLAADFKAKGVAIDDAHILVEIERCNTEARKSLGQA